MNPIYQLVSEYPIISLVQTLFMVAMAVHAFRRGSEPFWYWIIFFVPFLGSWVYFFAVVAPHLSTGNAGTWFERKATLEELRYRAEQTPTLANHLELGERLISRGEYAEAIPLLKAAQKVEPEHCSVNYALAACHVHLKKFDDASALLEAVTKRHPRWSDYAAWRLLIETHLDAGRPDIAAQRARELVALSPTFQHKCILSEILIDRGCQGEASDLLDRALEDHAFAPRGLRRRNGAWAKQAAKLLKRIQ